METEAKLDTVYAPSEDVVYREIDGEPIIVPLSAGVGDMEDTLFSLNSTGQAIWKRLDGRKQLAQVVEELSSEFDATTAEIQQSVLGFVGELLTRGMLVENAQR